ncbi:hypothetical protein RND81_10G251000 [Saponaria officinalis]|uniref:Uncharacterized protein n=1 Tax=Saponaria officinalis TaxID=3572 RepID=A0AAW1I6S8_SAPOF
MEQANDKCLLSPQGESEKHPFKRKRRGRPSKLPVVAAETLDQTPTGSDLMKPLGPIVMGLTHNDIFTVSRADNSGRLLKVKKKPINDDGKQLVASADSENMESEPQKGEVKNLKRKRGRPPKVLFGLTSPETNKAVSESVENKMPNAVDVASSTKRLSVTDEAENPVSVVEPLSMSISTPLSDPRKENLGIIGDHFIRLGDIRRLSLGKRSTARRQSRKYRKTSTVATLELANTIITGGKKLISTEQAEHPTGDGAECANNSRGGVEEDSDNGIGINVAVVVTSSNACGDDKPLSAWLDGAHSLPPSTDASRFAEIGILRGEIETPSCGQQKENTQDEKDETLAGDLSRNITENPDERLIQSTAIVPREGQELPFVKNSLVWGFIESMEVLKRIPQKPHFFPLYNCKEECREGLAIGSMVTFTGIAERIYRARFDDPKSLYEGYLESLVDLEELGFNVAPVRELLQKLISIKSRCEQAENTSKEIESQIMERKYEKSKMDDEIAELEKKIFELKEKQTLAVSKKETKDAEIAMLQLSMDAVKGGLASGQDEFEKVTASLW